MRLTYAQLRRNGDSPGRTPARPGSEPEPEPGSRTGALVPLAPSGLPKRSSTGPHYPGRLPGAPHLARDARTHCEESGDQPRPCQHPPVPGRSGCTPGHAAQDGPGPGPGRGRGRGRGRPGRKRSRLAARRWPRIPGIPTRVEAARPVRSNPTAPESAPGCPNSPDPAILARRRPRLACTVGKRNGPGA